MRLQEEEQVEVIAQRRFAWRLEYTLLIGVGLLLTLFALGFFYFGADIDNLKSYGYVGLFFINLIGAASIFLPSPAAASVVGAGAYLDDFLGIPATIWVGLVAGLGEACGEMVGYAAGYGGRVVVENQPGYERIHRWMDRHGTITMFVMSIIPNPLFDVGGCYFGHGLKVNEPSFMQMNDRSLHRRCQGGLCSVYVSKLLRRASNY